MLPLPALVLLAFASGVVALQTRATLPAYPIALIAGGVVALLWVRGARGRALQRVVRAGLAGAAAFALGFGYAGWRADLRLSLELPHAWEGADIAIEGIVDDLPATGAQGVRFAFAVERVLTRGAVVPPRVSLLWPVPWSDDDDGDAAPVPALRAGERWRVTVRLKRPHGNVNHGGFDLEAWLLQHGLRATGTVQERPSNVRVASFAGRASDHVQRAREIVRDRINAALAGRPYAGVVVALAIGDQRAIPEAQWTVFNRTGVGHLVSISGLHVTVFAAFAGALAFGVARRSARLTTRVPARKLATAVGVVAAGAYVLLAGAEVPAVRTFCMLAVAACGLWLGRPGTAGIVWLWALAVVLAWDPWAPLTPGFWLSYGAVALLLYAGNGRLHEPPPRRPWPRLRATLRDGAHAQWVVTIGLTPMVLALFQQVSLIAPLANAVAIPVVTLGVVPPALAGIAVPFDAPFVIAHGVLAPLMTLLEALAALPDATWQQHAPPPGPSRSRARRSRGCWRLVACPAVRGAAWASFRSSPRCRLHCRRARSGCRFSTWGRASRSSWRRAGTRSSTTPARATPTWPMPAGASSRRSCARPGCAAPTR